MEHMTLAGTVQPSDVDPVADAFSAAVNAPDPWDEDCLQTRQEILPLKWRFGRAYSDDATLTKLSGQHGYFVQTADGQTVPFYVTRSHCAGRRPWEFSYDYDWETCSLWLDNHGLLQATYATRASALEALGEAVLDDQDIILERPPEKHPTNWEDA